MFVRDKLAPLVGEPEVTLLNREVTEKKIFENLVSAGLGTPQDVADKHISSLRNERKKSSRAVKCAIDLLLGYFGSFRTAKLAVGSTSGDVVETIAEHLLFSARQLALLYCSGTEKVAKYAN